jgi:hypothetical protein
MVLLLTSTFLQPFESSHPPHEGFSQRKRLSIFEFSEINKVPLHDAHGKVIGISPPARISPNESGWSRPVALLWHHFARVGQGFSIGAESAERYQVRR